MKLEQLALIGVASIFMVGGCNTTIKTADGSYVKVTQDSREKVERMSASVSTKIQSESKVFVERKNFTSIKLELSVAEIDAKLLASKKPDEQISATDMEAARKLVIAEYEKFLKDVVYPAWAQFIDDGIAKKVKDLVAAGKFEEAREVAWNAPMTECEPVNSLVREFCIKLLQTDVNPVQWPKIEKELRDLAAKYKGNENELEKGRDAVAARALERAYSRKLDVQLAAVVAAAAKIGADKDKMKPVLGSTRKLLDAAANLVDNLDKEDTTVSTKKISDAFAPNLEAYENELAKFKADLIKFDCTKDNAEAAVKAVDAVIRPLFQSLSKEAKITSSTSSTLRLGITALNARIAKLKAELIAEFDQLIAAREQRKLEAKIADLRKRVEALVAQKKYDEARELAWKEAAEDARLRMTAVDLVAVTVNPVQWGDVEREFAQKTNEFTKAAKYDEAIAWLKGYRPIRTYAREIDARLDDVGARAKSLGVPEDKVGEVLAATRSVAAEVARLVDDTDAFKSNLQKVPFTEKDLAEALAAYRKALVRNDCTEENADKLVKDVYAKIYEAFLAAHPDLEKGYLVLGCNAFNARLAKLVAQDVEAMIAAKCRYVVDTLVAKVMAAVKAGKFAEARELIRNVPAIGDAGCDARVYAVRVGLLNSVVNPAQLDSLLAEIDAKQSSLLAADKCQELLDWVNGYKYVKDLYQDIAKALASVKGAALKLEITDTAASAYIAKLEARLAKMLDKRAGSWMPDADFKEVGEALEAFDKAISAQYGDKAVAGILCKKVDSEVRGLFKDHYEPLTTWELNEKLGERLMEVKDAILKHRAFCDSQIAMAESAIAEQLSGAVADGSGLRFNAVLGDYARAMRLRKLGGTLDDEMKKALILGSVYLGSSAVFECALSRGADVNAVSARDTLARTPLLLALQLGRRCLVDKLLAAGAKTDAVDANGDGAIHYAVVRGDIDLVWLMMSKGCDVNLKDKAGETPVFAAVRKDQQAIVALLTKSRDPKRAVAKVDVKNAAGETPFDVACKVGARESLETLVAAGSEYGVAQLVTAVVNERLAVVRWLVNRGVDVNAQGVMEAASKCSEVKTYLVSQGGIPLPCKGKCCNPEKPAEKAKQTAEATGTLQFKVTEAK